MDLSQDLAAIVGADGVTDEADVLEGYARDYSLVQPRRPSCVAYPQDAQQVQSIVRLANEHRVPVTPRSSGVGFYGAGIPSEGGIIVDLKRMNRILEIDPRNKKVKVEPGVNWVQVQEELEKHGLMVANPLLPHRSKSVLTSAMEREPLLIPKTEYSENLLTAELVLPNGEMFWTGTAIGREMKGQAFTEALIPGTRLWLGAQGTLGIMTWANIKAEWLPTMNKVFFLPFDDVTDLVAPVYQIERRMLGNECLVLNRFDLAAILAEDWPAEFESLRDSLPPWTVILCLAGLHRRPEEKIEYEEEALRGIASEFTFEVANTVAGIPGLGSTILKLLRKAWTKETYWKFQYKGSGHDVFFHTTLDKVGQFTRAVDEIAAGYGYPTSDIGVYLQPIERARACFCQFSFHCSPDDADEVEKVRELFLEASEAVISLGGLMSTPYGPWADMVYSRTTGYTSLLKLVKSTYDPNNILNPGKLCF